jgi:hypothetical protein
MDGLLFRKAHGDYSVAAADSESSCAIDCQRAAQSLELLGLGRDATTRQVFTAHDPLRRRGFGLS